jgi:hypothetical protein
MRAREDVSVERGDAHGSARRDFAADAEGEVRRDDR